MSISKDSRFIINNDRLEVFLFGHECIEERLYLIKKAFILVHRIKKMNILVVLDYSEIMRPVDEIQQAALRADEENRELKNKGLFVKVAILMPDDKSSLNSNYQQSYKDKNLDVSFFNIQQSRLLVLLRTPKSGSHY